MNGPSNLALKNYNAEYGNTFSFYPLYPALELLKQIVKSNTKIQGAVQILLVAGRLIYSELQKTTQNKNAKELFHILILDTYLCVCLKEKSINFL
jgi:hypothetical protein